MKKCLSFLVLLVLVVPISLAQGKSGGVDLSKAKDTVKANEFNEDLLCELVLLEMNDYMDSMGFEGFENMGFLEKVAEDYAEIMAEEGRATTNYRGPKKDVASRLEYFGGSGIGHELVMRYTLKGREDYYTYEELASNIMLKWANSTRTQRELAKEKFYFAGLGAKIGERNRKVYVSFMMGNHYTKNNDAFRVDEMEYPYTGNKIWMWWVHGYDYRSCRKCTRYFPDIVDLQKGLYIDDQGRIMFKYNDLRKFKRLIRSTKDGLAVDIVQKSQFNQCGTSNFVDYSKINRGIITKRVWRNKLYRKNEAPAEGRRERVKKLDVPLGEFPEALNVEDCELNLVIIKNRHVCYNIPPSFVYDAGYEYSQRIDLLADTVVPDGVPRYIPRATKNVLKFRIPFEKNKAEYKREDIDPVVKALNEPDFIIDKVHVAAYSSIEGSETRNIKLQQQRAESIIEALQEAQNESIIDSVSTDENWELFQKDVQGTKYEKLAKMKYLKAQKYISDNKLARKLEPILQNHRFADVTIWVTYDISGDKEEKYVLKQFNDRIKEDKLNEALSIQKYMFDQIVDGNYSAEAVSGMQIPEGKRFAGLNMNKIWLTKYVNDDPLDSTYCEQVNDLYALVEDNNPYIYYNHVYCGVVLDNIKDEYVREDIQDQIDYLYDMPLTKKTVDLLNVEMQYRIMDEYKDSLGMDEPIVQQSLERIKRIINFDQVTWQNSLKLASIFINHADYEYAFDLLDPFIDDERVFPELLFTYISLCSKVDHKIHSNRLVYALQRAKDLDEKRFCELFKGEDSFSAQVFANKKIKAMYCETCQD